MKTLVSRLNALEKIYSSNDRDAVQAAADELFFAFKIIPTSLAEAPRQVENFKAMVARHDLTDAERDRAIAIALSRRWGASVERFEWAIAETDWEHSLWLMALPPDARLAVMRGDNDLVGAG